MKNKYVLLLILLAILVACQQKTRKHYYKTGELWYETQDINKVSYYIKAYYKNGNIKEEGANGSGNHPQGHWKEYYSDGELKWEGDYDQGQRIISKDGKCPNFIKFPAQYSIEGSPSILRLGQSYKIRILLPQVHPSLYVFIDEYKHQIPENKEDPEKYPYVITPNKSGKVHYFILFPNKDGYFIIGNPMQIIELTVQK